MLYKIISILILSAASFVASAEIQQTDITLYRPFDAVHASQTLSGKCWTASVADPQPEAWRCMVDNAIYDPCFVHAYGKKNQAVCPGAPWNSQFTIINLTHPLPMQSNPALDMSNAMPWAVQLVNGAKCQIMTGATGLIDDQRINYACDNKAVLAGEIYRCKPVWQVFYKTPDDQALTKVAIEKAWF